MRLVPGTRLIAAALLFDMDGTLVDSTAAIERVWTRWSRRHGLDVGETLRTIHGVRIADTVQRLASAGTDIDSEIGWLLAAERAEQGGVSAIAGARELIERLPPGTWAVVTSADRELARRRMRQADLPAAPILVAAEDVVTGKPQPDGYRSAAELLGIRCDNALVFEDSDAGLEAGFAAGIRTIGVAAVRPSPFADHVEWIDDFTTCRLASVSPDGGIELEITA